MSAERERRRVRRVRVVIAEDADDFRLLLRKRLELDGRFVVVGEASNGQEAVDVTFEHGPDVVVMDLGMPVMDGYEAMRRIQERLPDAKVVVLSGTGANEGANEAFEAGAFSYLEKGTAMDRILTALAPLAPPEFEE
ncbi:MAG: response regulator [Nitriliruptorales bacterium]